MPSKRPAKSKTGLKRYALVVAALTLFWAAANEPAAFSVGAVVAWLLTALAVAMVACAILALAEPALLVGLRLVSRRQMQITPEPDEQP